MIFRRKPKRSQPICGCGHHLALHDRRNGRCHHSAALYNERYEVVRDGDEKPVLDAFEDVQTVIRRELAGTSICGCQQYIGPEPLNLFQPQVIIVPEETE